MIELEKSFDTILDCNYTLYSISYKDLREKVKARYNNYNLKSFDNRNNQSNSNLVREDEGLQLIKRSGIVSNMFYAYMDNNEFFLLDGFNRLLTDYGDVNLDTPVYLKVIGGSIEDSKLMYTMFNLNLWKLYNNKYGGFSVVDLFDRGFRLLLHTRFNINLYYYEDYSSRLRDRNDIHLIDMYFRDECKMYDSFKYSYVNADKLFRNKNIISDFKSLINANNYLKAPFKNYCMFLDGYAKFLSRNRLIGDNKEYNFNEVLSILYKDTKFFKKLQGMSGTDSTRINIYTFFNTKVLDGSI